MLLKTIPTCQVLNCAWDTKISSFLLWLAPHDSLSNCSVGFKACPSFRVCFRGGVFLDLALYLFPACSLALYGLIHVWGSYRPWSSSSSSSVSWFSVYVHRGCVAKSSAHGLILLLLFVCGRQAGCLFFHQRFCAARCGLLCCSFVAVILNGGSQSLYICVAWISWSLLHSAAISSLRKAKRIEVTTTFGGCFGWCDKKWGLRW
jgi:hypothetical protein